MKIYVYHRNTYEEMMAVTLLKYAIKADSSVEIVTMDQRQSGDKIVEELRAADQAEEESKVIFLGYFIPREVANYCRFAKERIVLFEMINMDSMKISKTAIQQVRYSESTFYINFLMLIEEHLNIKQELNQEVIPTLRALASLLGKQSISSVIAQLYIKSVNAADATKTLNLTKDIDEYAGLKFQLLYDSHRTREYFDWLDKKYNKIMLLDRDEFLTNFFTDSELETINQNLVSRYNTAIKLASSATGDRVKIFEQRDSCGELESLFIFVNLDYSSKTLNEIFLRLYTISYKQKVVVCTSHNQYYLVSYFSDREEHVSSLTSNLKLQKQKRVIHKNIKLQGSSISARIQQLAERTFN